MAGSIEQRGPTTWRVRASAGYDPVTQKRRVIRRTIEGTRQDAEEARARLVVEVSDDKWVGTTATLGDLFAAWLPHAQLSPAAAYDYKLVVRKHITPRIGHIQLMRLRAHHLDALYLDLATAGLSATRIRKAHTVIRSALTRAVKWRWIARNPAIDASPPSVSRARIRKPEAGDVHKVIELAAERSLQAHVLIHLAATLGCRRGELCGLQWADIDYVDRTITIRRTVGVIEGRSHVKETKTGTPREPAPIDDVTVELIEFWRVATADNDGPWVFTAPRGGFMRPDVASRLFRSLADQAGIPRHVHLHSLRHHVAKQLLDAGVPASVVAERLGHSRPSTTTDIYGGPVDGRAREAADILARINKPG